MTRNRVLVTTAWLSPGDEVHSLLTAAGCEVVHSSFKEHGSDPQRLARLLSGYDAVIAGTDPFSALVIAAADRLKVFGRTGVGYDNIDVAAATEHGIAVCPTPGVNRQSVAEHTFALLLACARGICGNVAAVDRGEWPQFSGRELSGSTLGIVGLGAIGKEVARIASAFGMRVVAHDPFIDPDFAADYDVESVPLDALLATADFTSLHIFLDDSTRHLIDAAAIAAMKDGAYLVNTARGGVVDEAALAAALRSGKLAGAALDVLETEPLPPDSPLRGTPNLLITAHIGAATVESRARSGRMAAEAVIDVLNGRTPAHVVNPEYAKAGTADA